MEQKHEFFSLFKKWFQNSSHTHTLVMFEALRHLPVIIKHLSLTSLSCIIWNLSLVFQLCQNESPTSSNWLLLIDHQVVSYPQTLRLQKILSQRILVCRESSPFRGSYNDYNKLQSLYLVLRCFGSWRISTIFL